jgi:hypothetical protein
LKREYLDVLKKNSSITRVKPGLRMERKVQGILAVKGRGYGIESVHGNPAPPQGGAGGTQKE